MPQELISFEATEEEWRIVHEMLWHGRDMRAHSFNKILADTFDPMSEQEKAQEFKENSLLNMVIARLGKKFDITEKDYLSELLENEEEGE